MWTRAGSPDAVGIQVVARIRPLSERELAAGDVAVAQVSAEDSNSVLVPALLCSRTAFI